MNGIRFTLPWAPSLNHAYPTVTDKKGKTRRVKSKALLAYREACGTHVLASSIPRFQFMNGERVAIWIFCRPPSDRAFDLDNRVKAVLDVLQYCGVIGNDGQVDEIHVERGRIDAPRGHLIVQVALRAEPEATPPPDPGRVVHNLEP